MYMKHYFLVITIKLEAWWEDLAYLTPRYPSAPLINIGGPIPITDLWPVQNGTQIKRAAIYTHAFLLIWQRLYRYLLQINNTIIELFTLDFYRLTADLGCTLISYHA